MRLLHPLLLLAALAGCASQRGPDPLARLEPCSAEDGPRGSYCGGLTVYENREAAAGRQIRLRTIVLPAFANDPAPDPLFFLVGGPGQGAAAMAKELAPLVERVRRRRDVVLVDQRGTGDSNGLQCELQEDPLVEPVPPARLIERLGECRAEWDADVRFYTTAPAMDDLDDVRAWLGYEQVNLYGGSYGTRAALVYLRRHEDHVRSVVLDGVAPTNMALPLYFARDAQRALDALLEACRAAPSCEERFPELRAKVDGLLARLDEPRKVEATHPRTGQAIAPMLSRADAAGALTGMLFALGVVAGAAGDRPGGGGRFRTIAGAGARSRKGRPADGRRHVLRGDLQRRPPAGQLRSHRARDGGQVSAGLAVPDALGGLRLLAAGRCAGELLRAGAVGEAGAAALRRARPGDSAVVGGAGRGDAAELRAVGGAVGGPWRGGGGLRHESGGALLGGPSAGADGRLVPARDRAAAVLRDAGEPDGALDGGPAMIEAVDLHKSFGATMALDGLSFRATDGAITGLLGPNGAGKTTALRILYGLLRPDKGSVSIDGVAVAERPTEARARLGVLTDIHGLYPRLTAREHIRFFGRLHGLRGAALERRTDELIRALDMQGIADRRAAGFSHGERMKTALARALVHDPQNLLLDEPTNGLDVPSVRAVRKILRRLRDEGRAVIFSSHVMQEVSALCDSVAVVAAGRVAAEGSPDDIRRQAGCESLEEAFVSLTGGEPAEEEL
ncbi:MAG: alpha/beta fold hydrolase [Acidobacteria bacterium]|nr:alpha/beta fold hydrolase [Acidobacteriota bacterium]